MPVLRAKVTRCVSINILGVDVGSMLNQSLDDAEIASKASDVQRCSKIVGPCIYLGVKFDQNLNQWSMAFTCCQMKRCKAVRICTVDDFKELVVLVELLLSVTQDFEDFVGISLIHFCPVVHLNFFNVFLSLFLWSRFLGDC